MTVFWPLSLAEFKAGIDPYTEIDVRYPWGDVRRHLASANQSTDRGAEAMTAPDDLTKVLDELEIDITLHSHLDAYDPQQLRALVRIARAADAFERFVMEATPDSDMERGFGLQLVLRAALDALCNGGK